jgi:uncharacterized protein YbjT (DUF2867 family)
MSHFLEASMATTRDQAVLVLGGTGKTGRRVAQRLQALGVPTCIGSRSGTPAFDWEDPATWRAALQGMTAAYIAYHPDLAVPGASEVIRAFSATALECGVTRLVLLSGRGEDGAERSERALRESGADWTILRCSWFFQNFSESFLRDAVLSGTIALPVGGVLEPFVDADDIAEVAVAALTRPGHSRQLYELTGPRLMSFGQAAQEISAALARPVGYQPIALDDFLAGLREAGLGEPMLWLMNELFAQVLDGRNSSLADGVQRALGRAPGDFTDFLRREAAAGRWAA